MNEDYVKKRILKIRKLISEARHIEAFEELEAVIIEIDGEEVENARERELLNQLLAIKSRFSLFNKKMLQGMQEDNIELNQITASLLSLTDSIKDLADENPASFLTPSVKENHKSFSAQMAIDPDASKTPVGINELSNDGSQNNGCLNILADDKKSNNLVSIIKAVSPILLLSILLIGAFFIFKEFDGCGKTVPAPPPTDKPEKVVPPPPPVALGKTGKELGFDSDNSMSKLADHLSDPNTNIPHEFKLDEVAFAKNSARLNSQAKQQLNDLAVALKEYDKTNIDIYGFVTNKEKSSYKGSKELSLDDVRARSVTDYLKSIGINENRMNFQGFGTQENNNPVIRILNR